MAALVQSQLLLRRTTRQTHFRRYLRAAADGPGDDLGRAERAKEHA
ncbi:MAG: hypothetical protein ACLP19_01240 [Xanthobacteraceae bacterium]